MRPFSLSRVLAVLAMAVLAVAASACSAGAATQVTEQLVPPPNIPAPSPRGGAHVIVNLTAEEKTAEIAPGVNYDVWSFNGSVPAPMIRVRVGDTVEIRLKNDPSSKNVHDIDLHAVTGPGGGAGATVVKPGEEKSFTFKAKAEGLFAFHCAQGIVADHIANGMYGAILVEPANGLDTVDHEYYIGQGEWYTDLDLNAKGNASLDFNKLMNEQPTYVTWNGNTKSLTGNGALQAKVGETVRLYVVNGGPNLTSSFHVIGEIFDRTWLFGGLESPPLRDLQTVTVPPGGSTVVQFKLDVPGDYKLVDHATSRLSRGAAGILHVTGAQNRDVFDAPGETTVPATTPTTAATPSPSATASVPVTATATATAAPSGTSAPTTGTNTVSMIDNAFVPDKLTAKAGQKVTFTLTNDGKVPHNMQIAGLDGNFDKPVATTNPELVSPGKTGTLEWTPAAPGTYKFRCEVHPDQMTGTITVS
ncbi:MAG: copper-containing nitrite reductase [Dehalococcoidia bacterium]|nr:copper-containing nitrite reductase [Dehalococcoidia bacterium]